MITDVVQPLLDWITQHPGWALSIVFIIAFFECLAVVGLFLPGTVLMISIGAIVATGSLGLLPTLLCAVSGAILGDGLSFWMGRHFRQHLHVVWPFRRYPALLRRGTNFFYHHGGKSVFLSRFLGPVRPILPAVAGMLDMPVPRFLVIDAVAALLWAPTYILPGLVLGASLQLAAEVAGRLAVLSILLLVILWFSLWTVRRLLWLMQSHASGVLLHLLDWSRNHPRIRPLAGALLDPNHPEARGLSILAGLWVLASALFALIFTGVLGNAPLTGIDHYLFHLLQGLRTPWADALMVRVTELGDPFVRNSIFLAVLAWLAWTRHWSAAIHWSVAYCVVAVLTRGLKLLVQIERPTELYTGASSFAFPSGHASMSMTLYGFLAVLIAGELSAARRWIPYGFVALLIVPIGLSRLYLGAHWFTDVAGGIALGFCWVALLGVGYRRNPRPPIALTGLVTVAACTFVLAAFLHNQRMFSFDLARYTVARPMEQIGQAAWQERDWRRLPTYRQDLEGSQHHPITLQWVGDLKGVQGYLQASGWTRPVALELHNSMRWLVPATPIDQLPVLPQVHDGRHEALRMIHKNVIGGGWLIVRLWDSNYRVEETQQPLWIGNVSRLEVLSPLGLFAALRTGHDFNEPLTQFKATVKRLTWQQRQRFDIPPCDQRQHCAPVWDGTVLLIETPLTIPPPHRGGG